MNNILLRISALLLTLSSVSGCAVTTWGSSYTVLNATPDQIVLEYDRVLINPSILMPVVSDHCAKFGKKPYMMSLGRTLGIGTIAFDCR